MSSMLPSVVPKGLGKLLGYALPTCMCGQVALNRGTFQNQDSTSATPASEKAESHFYGIHFMIHKTGGGLYLKEARMQV